MGKHLKNRADQILLEISFQASPTVRACTHSSIGYHLSHQLLQTSSFPTASDFSDSSSSSYDQGDCPLPPQHSLLTVRPSHLPRLSVAVSDSMPNIAVHGRGIVPPSECWHHNIIIVSSATTSTSSWWKTVWWGSGTNTSDCTRCNPQYCGSNTYKVRGSSQVNVGYTRMNTCEQIIRWWTGGDVAVHWWISRRTCLSTNGIHGHSSTCQTIIQSANIREESVIDGREEIRIT